VSKCHVCKPTNTSTNAPTGNDRTSVKEIYRKSIRPSFVFCAPDLENPFAPLLHGLWWWFLPPVIIIMLVFVGLYLVSSGLDEFANPRTRRAV
jgi:hypothetical protein